MQKTGRGSNVARSAARYDPEKKYARRMLQSAHRPGGTLQPAHRIVAGAMALIASAPAWAGGGAAPVGGPPGFIFFWGPLFRLGPFFPPTPRGARCGPP